MPNLPTNIVGFRGFDSSIILFVRGGILMSIGDFPESLSQAMLAGLMLVGRLGVVRCRKALAMIPGDTCRPDRPARRLPTSDEEEDEEEEDPTILMYVCIYVYLSLSLYIYIYI